MPYRQFGDAGAQSTVSGAITNSQTSVTLASAAGFPALVQGGQCSVTILDSGAPGYSAANPLASNYEYQQVNGISGNVLTFGPGGGSAARSSYAGTTPKAFFAGATVALSVLAEDIVASAPLKFDEQIVTNVGSIFLPAGGVGAIPASYLGVTFRNLRLTWSLRSTSGNAADYLYMRFNGDAAANYGYQTIDSTSSSVSGAFVSSGNPRIASIAGGTAPSTNYGQGRCEVFYYGATDRYHNYLANAMYVANPMHTEQNGGWWLNTAAITTVTLLSSSGNLTGTVTTYLEP